MWRAEVFTWELLALLATPRGNISLLASTVALIMATTEFIVIPALKSALESALESACDTDE